MALRELLATFNVDASQAVAGLKGLDAKIEGAASQLGAFTDALLGSLSGGALLGLYHFGVIKTLFEQDLLPRTISGSSMGSIMAAWTAILRSHSSLLVTDSQGRATGSRPESPQLGEIRPIAIWRSYRCFRRRSHPIENLPR